MGRVRWKSGTAVRDRSSLERLGVQCGEYSRGMSAFDVRNTDQRQHQQGLEKTTG